MRTKRKMKEKQTAGTIRRPELVPVCWCDIEGLPPIIHLPSLHCISIRVWLYIYVYLHIYVCIYICIYMCVYIYVFTCIYIYIRPTQSMIHVPLLVNRFQKSVLLIIWYKYLKSCTKNFMLQDLILRTRLCGTGFIHQHC